ncbi:MAG: hypothetical protein HYT13_01755 [Candidatus Liptonbacteria bacterium]|nr:hypothetical protein [Candidatus Liptonbacteria bacterium]
MRGASLVGIIFLVVLIIAGGVYFLLRGGGSPNVSLEFSKPDQVLLGQPFSVTVSFSNYSESVLKNTKLSLALPEGVSFLGQSPDQKVMEQTVGDLGVGSLSQQTFSLIVTSGSQSLKRLMAKLIYATEENLKVQFVSIANADIPVGQPAISLNLGTPANVFSGESFAVKVSYQNNTNEDFKNLGLKIDYPSIFRYQKSTLDPTSGNNFWRLGALTRGSDGSFTITGSVVGPEQSFFNVDATLTADFLGQNYTLGTQTASVAISVAPLSLSISVNESMDYIAKVGDTLRYVLRYRNNSDTALQNVVIQTKLTGELLDFQTARSEASLNSLTNTFSWGAANTPELLSLAPGQEGTVNLEIRLLHAFPIRRLSDKNYTLKAQAEIQSPTVPQNTTAEKTLSVTSLETKVAGQIAIDSRAFFRDAASGFLNSGPYPPKVNVATQYTIHWLITNYSTDVVNIQVSAYLQSGSRFTGKFKSNLEGQPPVFDQNSGRVLWQVRSIPATKGIVGEPAEAIFQIETTPAVNQVGQELPLLSETRIQALDSFTNLTLESSDGALNTSLPDDPTIQGDRRVQP